MNLFKIKLYLLINMDINYLSDEEIVNEQNSNNKNNENYDNIYDEMCNDEEYDEEYDEDEEYNEEKNQYLKQQKIIILNALQKKQNYILDEENPTIVIKKNTQVNKNMNVTELNIHIDKIIKESTPAKFVSSRFLQKKQNSNDNDDNIIKFEITKRTFNPRLPPFFQRKYNN